MTSFSDSSSCYSSTAQSGPSGPFLLMQHSHPTLAFKPLILFSPTFYLLPLHSHHWLMILAVSLYPLLSLPLPDSLRALQLNVGGLRARSTELLHFISSHPVDLFAFRNPTLIYFPLSRSLDSLLCDPMALTIDLVFFLLMSQTLVAASSFSLARAYPSLSFLPPLFLRLTPNLIM